MTSPRPSAPVLLARLTARARLRHLQVLVSVAELGSFKRAAAAVGLTQPAVTHVVGDLERLLDAPLFQRHARGATPLEAALTLVPVARRMLDALAEGAEVLAARLAHADGVVRLASSASALGGLLQSLLPAFCDAAPQVQVLVSQAEADLYAGMVARDEVDAVACRQPAVAPEGWQFHALRRDALVVVCAPTHPLARRRRVPVAELARETWLAPPAGSLARRGIDALAEAQGWSLAIAPVVTRALPLTFSLLQHRRSVTLVPLGVVQPLLDSGQLAQLRVDHAWPLDDLGLLLPAEGMGAASARLLAFAQGPGPWHGMGQGGAAPVGR